MNPSPLQLERHFFSKVQIDANPDGEVGVSNMLSCEVELGAAQGDPTRFQVILRLKILSEDGKHACYTGEIHAVGLFRVVDGWPEEKKQPLVQTNGATLLFGAIREMVLNITSRGPWPPLLLNSFSFVQPKPEQTASTCVSKPEPAR